MHHSIRLAALLSIACCGVSFSDSENLLRNSSFEEAASAGNHNQAQYWVMGSPDENGDFWGSAARENWRAYEGEHLGAVRGLWAGAGTSGGFWQDAPAVPGARYRFRGWFYADTEWSAQTQEVKLEFLSQDKLLLIDQAVTVIGECDMTWVEIPLEATAPEGAAWVRVVINVMNSGASGALQFDELTLQLVQ